APLAAPRAQPARRARASGGQNCARPGPGAGVAGHVVHDGGIHVVAGEGRAHQRPQHPRDAGPVDNTAAGGRPHGAIGGFGESEVVNNPHVAVGRIGLNFGRVGKHADRGVFAPFRATQRLAASRLPGPTRQGRLRKPRGHRRGRAPGNDPAGPHRPRARRRRRSSTRPPRS
nr:hypothetical protein [Tanacetum cinerariifolium]